MSNKVLFSLATVALFAATAKADTEDTYEVVSTNVWFTAGDSADENWTQPNSGITNWVGRTVLVDTAATDPLIYTPTAASATADGYRVKANVKFTRCESAPTVVPTNSMSAALGALAVTTNNWYGVDGDEWVPLYGLAVPVNDETLYNVTIDFKTNGVQNLVRYTVGTTVLENSSGTAWLTRGRDDAVVTKVGIAGYGELASLSGDTVSYFDIDLTADQLAAAGIETPVTADKLGAIGANGLPKWQSFVLGLDPTVATSKPYIAPIQNNSASEVTFALGGVAPMTGYKVEYAIKEVSLPTSEVAGELTYNNANATVNVAPGDSAVKYYKIKIKITK